jgi:hypothetical protein
MSSCVEIGNYNIGDFVKFQRKISLKPNTYNIYRDIGIIVKKGTTSDTCYINAKPIQYLISIERYGGDYVWVDAEGIENILSIPIEYKISLISKFGDWWYDQHKSIYQQLLVDIITNN